MPAIEPPRSQNELFAPPYRKIESDLRRLIDGGEWKLGNMIPSRRDLAARYGVDVNTVQRAIKVLLDDGLLRAEGGRGTYVSGGVAAAVDEKDVAEAPNADFAESNHPLQTNATLGIVFPLSGNPDDPRAFVSSWNAIVVRAMEQEFRLAGGSVFVVSRNDGSGGLLTVGEALRMAIRKGVDALAYVTLNNIQPDIGDIMTAIDHESFSFVCTSGDAISAPIPHVTYDSRQAGYQATNHLIRQGCAHIVYFAPYAAQWSSDRLVGVREAIRHAGLPEDALAVYPETQLGGIGGAGEYEELGRKHGRAAFAAGIIKQGVVAENDHVACGLIDAARETGMVSGSDFAVIGFDDTDESVVAGLSSMRPPFEAIGQEAARSILRSLRGERQHGGHIKLRSQLIVRSSSGLNPEKRTI